MDKTFCDTCEKEIRHSASNFRHFVWEGQSGDAVMTIGVTTPSKDICGLCFKNSVINELPEIVAQFKAAENMEAEKQRLRS